MRLRGTALALATLCSVASCQRLDPLYCDKNPGMCDGDAGVGGGVYKITVTVTGLTGLGLVLENNGGDDLPIAQNGKFTFATLVDPGANYSISVATPPTMPAQMCIVTNGIGIANADVGDVQVACQTQTFNLGGFVGGLNAGTQVVLANNGSDMVTVNTNGMFTFPMQVPSNSGYLVNVKTQPASGGPCNVFGGTGTVGNTDVTSIVVNCSSTLFAIGGTVTGLIGTVKLTNATNGDVVTISSNGTYAFPMLVSGAYNVSVTQQPTYPPAQQTCSVANGGMHTATANVTNLDVTCTTSKYTISGSISGLTGTVVLQDNGTDDLSRNANGGFTFATSIASGSSYMVTVKTQPSMEACNVSNGGGTVKTSNITNVMVSCKYQDPGIACGSSFCDPATTVCCDPYGGATCSASSACFNFQLPCDDAADCTAAGTPGVCCVFENGGGNKVNSVACTASRSCGGPQLCDPNAPSCSPMKQCRSFGLLPGYYSCQ